MSGNGTSNPTPYRPAPITMPLSIEQQMLGSMLRSEKFLHDMLTQLQQIKAGIASLPKKTSK